MFYGLECALTAQRHAAERLAEHFADKNDDKGFALFDEVLDASHMVLVVMNDQIRAAQKAKV